MSRSLAADSIASQPRKRRADADQALRVRSASSSCLVGQQLATEAPVLRQNPLELRAFGLEDRADAVISTGSKGWSLSNLSQWRQEMIAQAAQPSRPPQDYIVQRQRLYKQQMLRGARQPPVSQ